MANSVVLSGSSGGSPGPDRAVVKSAGRVLEVFELLATTRRPLSATEIGRILGYPKSSANVLLKSLTQLGYLSFDADSMQYFPSLRITALGEWIPAALFGVGDAASMLQDVHDKTAETVTLSMRSGLSMRFLRVMPGKFFIALKMDEGTVAPLFGSAVGAAFLGTRGAEEVDRLTQSAYQQVRTRQARAAIESTVNDLQRVRQQGYAVTYGSLFPDTGAIGMALPPASDGNTLVLGVGGLQERVRRNEKVIARAMRSAISQHLTKPGVRARRG